MTWWGSSPTDEIVIYTTGTREICALESLKEIEFAQHEDGSYQRYYVRGDEQSFQVIAAPVWQDRILVQEMGAIVG